MGLNSVAVLLNDCCHEMERGGEIGQRMSEAIRHWSRVKGGGDFRVGHIISMSHSSAHQVVIVHGNTGRSIHDAVNLPYYALDAMADCLKRHGWSAKAPKRKRTSTKKAIEADASP